MKIRLLSLVLLLAGCGPDVPNLDSPGTTIVCLGDSITSGVGTGPGEAYCELLSAKLGIELINAGVPGDTTEDGLARVEDVLAQNPWMVIVELGGNDILGSVPPARSEAALRQILDRLLAARVVPVLVEIEVPFRGQYADVFERIGDDYDIPVVDESLGEILLDSDLKADPIHPNAAGHQVLAEAVADVVEPIVEARAKR
ncbi:MAG TPA: GDSL-type esterase/lipase family protein [Thermoanaerobaculia bacterium]|nr:GDSL-type esterase/lipase family protein [Thermoanaerobaculia bacterium]